MPLDAVGAFVDIAMRGTQGFRHPIVRGDQRLHLPALALQFEFETRDGLFIARLLNLEIGLRIIRPGFLPGRRAIVRLWFLHPESEK